MIKKITLRLLLVLIWVICPEIQGSVVTEYPSQHDIAKQYNDFKLALLVNDKTSRDAILNQNPTLLSYADPKTGRMIYHDIFLHSYPLNSLNFIMQNLDNDKANQKDKSGNRPLHYLLRYSQNYTDQELYDTLKFLLEKRHARPLSKNEANVTPLHLAAQVNNPHFLKLLIESLPPDYAMKGYLDWKDNQSKTPLMYALDAENEKNVVTLLQQGALFDANFMTYIEGRSQKELEKYLQEHSQDSFEQNQRVALDYKNTYLKKMAKWCVLAKKISNSKDILCELLKKRLDVNFQDERGNTLLHYAANTYDRRHGMILVSPRANNEEMVEALLALGANPEIQNNFESIPDLNENYSTLFDYYKPLQNSLEMDQARQTLFGQSVMNLYDLYYFDENQELLKQVLCSNHTDTGIPELTQIKARAFFKNDFIKKIC